MESAELTLPVAMVTLRPWDWILFFTHKHDRTPPEAPLTLPPPPHGLTSSPLPPPPSFPSLGLCFWFLFFWWFFFFLCPLSTMGFCLFPNCLGLRTMETVLWAASDPDLVRNPFALRVSPT